MIDLHIHTTCSDGTLTPRELLIEAEKLGLSTISITDHNTAAAYDALPSCRELFSGRIIPGIEITTSYEGAVVELLGYGFELEKMKELLAPVLLPSEIKQERLCELVVSAMTRSGAKIDVQPIIDNRATRIVSTTYKQFIAEEKNKRLLLSPESATDMSRFCRMELYNPNSKLFINMGSLYPDFQRTIDIIHEAGGLAFLAHTYAYFPSLEPKLEGLVSRHNIDGFETKYTIFSDSQSRFLMEFCSEHKLFMSGGSDFHGKTKENFALARGFGNLNILESHISPWSAAVRKI